MLLYSEEGVAVGVSVFLIILIIVLIAVEILLIVACGKKASAKGRSVEAWVIIALLFGGLIPYIILCCLPDNNYYSGYSSNGGYVPNDFRNSFANQNNNRNNQNQDIRQIYNANREEYGGLYGQGNYNYYANANNTPKKAQGWNCPYCGRRNTDDRKFCINCGAPKDE